MLQLIQLKKCDAIRSFIDRPPLRPAFLLVPLVLACFGLSPAARALNPAPDGGYANGNTAEGTDPLHSLTSGAWNTALGYRALFSDTTGGANTATGYDALYHNNGQSNTANGSRALFNNTTGRSNTANGANALFSNTVGIWNTANGSTALQGNTTGSQNTAVGVASLTSNSTGGENTAVGVNALYNNTAGGGNTASGFNALYNNIDGGSNTATGIEALLSNTIGFGNTADGAGALASATTGFQNTATGSSALSGIMTGSNNTANGFGALANSAGNDNIALGSGAGTLLRNGNSNIDIGNWGLIDDEGIIRIGTQGTQTKTFIAGIGGVTIASGIPVVVDGATGQLGIAATSSRRFKAEIKPMDDASEAILALKPVTFRYEEKLDPKGTPQFGLVAEEVEKVNPALVTCDAKGEVYTVRYEAVNAMLLNEFLKAHRRMEEQEATITQLKDGMKILTASLKEQAAQIQKVSDQLEVSKAAPQMVVDNQ